MLSENDFHKKADYTLHKLMGALEEADASGALEVELAGGLLTIIAPDGQQCVVSKHAASGEVWLASPVMGGLHFAAAEDGWQLKDGRMLEAVLAEEVRRLAGISVDL